jgi:hypothetical protein
MTTDALSGALDMMVECLEYYANAGGVGYEAIEAEAGADEFARYAADIILDDMGVV